MSQYEPSPTPHGGTAVAQPASHAPQGTARHAAILLGVLGAVSGIVSTLAPGPDIGTEVLPANLGLYMVLAGFWFGLVTGFGVFRFANRAGAAVSGVLLGTWLAWEVAVNVAIQLDENLLEAAGLDESVQTYISGFVAGEVGAILTWAAAAWFSRQLRQGQAAIMIGAVGALFGLLLAFSMDHDTLALLFVPWQAAVAATLGWFLVQPARAPHGS